MTGVPLRKAPTTPVPCATCGRPATVGPAWRSGIREHHCGSCRVMWVLAQQNCPPRYSFDTKQAQTVLANRYQVEWKIARGSEVSAWWVGFFEWMVPAGAMAECRRWHQRADWRFLFDVIYPELVAERERAEARLRQWHQEEEAHRDRVRAAQMQISAARGTLLDLNNPFQDPEFMRRLLEGADL